MSDFSADTYSETLAKDLIGCRHVAAVLSDITHTLFPYLLDSVTSEYRKDLIGELQFKMITPPEPLSLGSWQLSQWKYTTEKGTLLIYLSEVGQLIMAARAVSSSSLKYYHCFDCPYTRQCSHVSLLPRLDSLPPETFDESNDERGSRTESGQFDAMLFSTEGYPFSLNEDVELCKHISRRRTVGIRQWLQEECPDGVLEAETRVCCEVHCEGRIANRNNRQNIDAIEVWLD